MDFYTSPLNHKEEEIRLLRIDLSEAAQHELISNVSLRSKRQQYHALSYTWGDQGTKISISINRRIFQISNNLNEALHSIQAFWKQTYGTNGKPLLLWCDQICINQASDDERSRQVAYMSEIYRRAEQVLVWLPVPASVSAGFEDWPQWKSWHERQVKTADLQAAYTSPQPMEYRQEKPSSQTLIAAWANVRSIVESPWWSRAWVYQEFLLATRTTFLIDGLVVPWAELRDLIRTFVTSLRSHTEALGAAVTTLDEAANQFDLNATDQIRERSHVDEKADKYSEGCGAQCQSWHLGYKECLNTSCDPCRKDSIFYKVYDYSCGAQAEKEPAEGCVCAFVSGFCIHVWCPIAALEYLAVALGTPLCYLATFGPWSTNKEQKLNKKRDDLSEKVTQNRDYAAESRRVAQDLLRPHEANLSTMSRSWATAQSIMSSKDRMMDGTSAPLSELMKHARNCQCYDPRDKIFAFLGVAGPSYGLSADYTPTNTLHDVVTEATAAVITTEGSLEILNDAKEENEVSRALDHLPSWVPNFTTPDNLNTEYQSFIKGIRLPSSGLCASGDSRAKVSFHADRHGNPNRILRARGVKVGRLARIVEDPPFEPWRVFEDDAGRNVGTRSNARPGDEVWVLFGADVPFTLTKPSAREECYEILGQAMVWDGGEPAGIMYGGMIELLAQGRVGEEEVAIM